MRGLKPLAVAVLVAGILIVSSKNQNPREGIETRFRTGSTAVSTGRGSKNQNPREGIETQIAQT